ncbi:uncharacterized protein LOC141641679 [Silene latifolia]|uniref:uncharacterized protein LOC141641679 n=1 Tax=Silene latifolia TaxID=37657 RepID=UPI003D7866F0
MDFEIEDAAGAWRVMGFYGWLMVSDRHLSWELLRMIGAGNGDSPWLCIGDFNEILYGTEMRGGVRPQWQMNNFRDAVDDCRLRDVGFEGYEFTYDNGQEEEDNRQSRIGRAMGNDKWFDMFPRAKLVHMDREWSDHAPIKVILQPPLEREVRGGKLFRFKQIWVGKDGCEDAIRKAWSTGNGDLIDTILDCARHLHEWKGVSIGKILRDLNSKRTEAVAAVAKNYFEGLFSSDGARVREEFLDVVAGRVTEEMNVFLRAEYREDEVITALNQMHPLKSPGLDGMNALFYQTYWHIVGPIKGFLGNIVSENQSAFTPGRLISDNILIAFELFHQMKNNRSGDAHMALKLDMAKAYDRVEWYFLERVLRRMGFDDGWVDNAMKCVSTVTFSIKVNGTFTEEFAPTRGIRQGDPISPYLFILCAGVLSGQLRKAAEDGSIRGIRVAPAAPTVTHLLFADDSVLFVRAKEMEARKVKAILTAYEEVSGQLVNYNKTTVYFSKCTTVARRGQIADWLGVRAVDEHDKYFGLPTIVGHSKQVINRAWRMVTDRACLMVRVLGGKYFPNRSFMKVELGTSPSYTWRSIYEAKEALMVGIRRRVCNGLSTRVWYDPWVSGTKTRMVLSPMDAADDELLAAELLDVSGKAWDISKVRKFFHPFEQQHILNTRIGGSGEEDEWVWDLEKGSIYSVRSAYKALMGDYGVDEGSSDGAKCGWLWRKIWNSRTLPRVKMFFWQFCSDAIATKWNLASRMKHGDVTCPICSADVEDCLHLAGGCGYTVGVWESLGLVMRPIAGYEGVKKWVEDVLGVLDKEEIGVFMTGVWAIWEMRNKVVFENRVPRVEDVVLRVRGMVGELDGVERAGEQRLMGMQGRNRDGVGVGRGVTVDPGVVIINVDVGVKEGEGMGLGALCGDEDGNLLWGWEGRRREEFEERVAEAEAVLNALREAQRMKHARVCVESDCKTVIEALKCRTLRRSDFHIVISNTLKLCVGFNSVSWSYVCRTFNRAAHLLAHSCAVDVSRFLDGTFIPRYIVETAKTDLLMRV